MKLAINLQADMEAVGDTGDRKEAVELATRLLPDVVVLDIIAIDDWFGSNQIIQPLAESSPIIEDG